MNQILIDRLTACAQKKINAKLKEEFLLNLRACFDGNGRPYYIMLQLPDGSRKPIPLAALLPFSFLKVVRIHWVPLPVGSR